MNIEMESGEGAGMDDIQSNRGQDTDTTDQFDEKEGDEDIKYDYNQRRSNNTMVKGKE